MVYNFTQKFYVLMKDCQWSNLYEITSHWNRVWRFVCNIFDDHLWVPLVTSNKMISTSWYGNCPLAENLKSKRPEKCYLTWKSGQILRRDYLSEKFSWWHVLTSIPWEFDSYHNLLLLLSMWTIYVVTKLNAS